MLGERKHSTEELQPQAARSQSLGKFLVEASAPQWLLEELHISLLSLGGLRLDQGGKAVAWGRELQRLAAKRHPDCFG